MMTPNFIALGSRRELQGQCSMALATPQDALHPKSYAIFAACPHHWRSAARLVCGAMLRLHLRRCVVVDRAGSSACRVGAVLGSAGSLVPVRSTLRPGADVHRAGIGGDTR